MSVRSNLESARNSVYATITAALSFILVLQFDAEIDTKLHQLGLESDVVSLSVYTSVTAILAILLHIIVGNNRVESLQDELGYLVAPVTMMVVAFTLWNYVFTSGEGRLLLATVVASVVVIMYVFDSIYQKVDDGVEDCAYSDD